MEKVCPICNGLADIDQRCPRCGSKLLDGGPLENYYGPYSPYSGEEVRSFGILDTHCVHLLYCSECGFDTRSAWQLEFI